VSIKLYHLHCANQYNCLLVALFQGKLFQVFGVALIRAGANLELLGELPLALYLCACVDKSKAVEDKNPLKFYISTPYFRKNREKPSVTS
jgi:hypothetical protein